jgi:4-hydroxy-tetrahydrodipicolinate reductase
VRTVVVVGAGGRLGRELADAIAASSTCALVGAVDTSATGTIGGCSVVPSLHDVRVTPDVVLITTTPDAVVAVACDALDRGSDVVIGTSGVSDATRQLLHDRAVERDRSVLVVPNFALGAVLLLRFAAIAAKFFPSVEVIELHHPNKLDAPSGTATHTVETIAAARAVAGLGTPPDATAVESLPGARGAVGSGGIHVHAVRLMGLVAHEEVLFGGPGEQLTLRHDSMDRSSFVAGALLAVQAVGHEVGLSVGLDQFLDGA